MLIFSLFSEVLTKLEVIIAMKNRTRKSVNYIPTGAGRFFLLLFLSKGSGYHLPGSYFHFSENTGKMTDPHIQIPFPYLFKPIKMHYENFLQAHAMLPAHCRFYPPDFRQPGP